MSSVDIHRKPSARWEVRRRKGGRRRGRTFDRKGDATNFRDHVRGRMQRAGIPTSTPVASRSGNSRRSAGASTRSLTLRLPPARSTCACGRSTSNRASAPTSSASSRRRSSPTFACSSSERSARPPSSRPWPSSRPVCKQAVIHGRMELNPVAVIDKPHQSPSSTSHTSARIAADPSRARTSRFVRSASRAMTGSIARSHAPSLLATGEPDT
jgi:hypothetical protein